MAMAAKKFVIQHMPKLSKDSNKVITTPQSLEQAKKFLSLFSNNEMHVMFPSNIIWDNKQPPNPHVHSLDGQHLFFIHWEFFPGVQFKCNFGKSCLLHNHTNFSKNK